MMFISVVYLGAGRKPSLCFVSVLILYCLTMF